MAEKYILPEHSYILVVGNKDEVAPTLAGFDADNEVEFYNYYGEPAREKKPDEELRQNLPDGLTAKDVIDKYIQARGGAKKMKKIKHITTKATAGVQGMELNVSMYQQTPDKFMMEMSMNNTPVMKQLYDGEHGYIRSMMGEMEVKGDTLTQMKEQALLFPAMHFDEPGYKLELSGTEEIDGQETYIVDITTPGNLQITDYFSASTGLLIRTVTHINGMDQASDLSEYREVNGVKFPFKRETKMGPQTVTITVTELDTKSKIKDEVFEMGE